MGKLLNIFQAGFPTENAVYSLEEISTSPRGELPCEVGNLAVCSNGLPLGRSGFSKIQKQAESERFCPLQMRFF